MPMAAPVIIVTLSLRRMIGPSACDINCRASCHALPLAASGPSGGWRLGSKFVALSAQGRAEVRCWEQSGRRRTGSLTSAYSQDRSYDASVAGLSFVTIPCIQNLTSEISTWLRRLLWHSPWGIGLGHLSGGMRCGYN
jgi:hypothetical protein